MERHSPNKARPEIARVTEAHLEARRDQIVNAAWTCFSRKGYHQTTMQDIASEAGISAGAIYRYFPGKEAVLKAINDRSQEIGRALIEAARARSEGPLDALTAIGQTMLPFFNDAMFDTVSRVNIEIWPEIIRSQELREGYRGELTFWRSEVTALLREAQARGQLKPEVNVDALATVLMCNWEGLRHYRLISEDFKPEAIIDVFRALIPEDVLAEVEWLGENITRQPPEGGPIAAPLYAPPWAGGPQPPKRNEGGKP